MLKSESSILFPLTLRESSSVESDKAELLVLLLQPPVLTEVELIERVWVLSGLFERD